MIRGVLSAATAMRAQVLNQEVIANNLANADTLAYQKEKTVFQSFHDVLMYRIEHPSSKSIGGYTGGTVLNDIFVADDTGPLETTLHPLDIALPPGNFLALETPLGIRYTRRGDLSVNGGFLTVGGLRVLGMNGPVAVDSGTVCSISRDGSVQVDEETTDKLSVFSFKGDFSVVKEGGSLINMDGGTPELVETPEVSVGVLEKSTVDPVFEMVNLISSMRAYEAAQRALRSHDETLEQAINRVGRV